MAATGARSLLLAAACIWRSVTSTPLPPCEFDACEQCLPDALPKGSRVNLAILGPDDQSHDSPFRIARSETLWDSQAVLAHIVGILASERLGIHVEYVHVDGQATAWYAVNNCIGWTEMQCDQYEVAGEAALVGKAFGDVLADVMFTTDLDSASIGPWTFQGTQLTYDDRPSVSLGPCGYTEIGGLFMFGDVVERARADGVEVSWLPSLATANVTRYFDTPQRLMGDGVVAEVQGCNSSVAAVELGMALVRTANWTCDRSWWLNPACAAHGARWASECLVFIDDDWSEQKPDLFRALTVSKAPVAKLAVGYEGWQNIVSQRHYSLTFWYWTEDALLAAAMPVLVRMPLELEGTPSILMKAGWGPALQADRRLYHFLEALYLPQDNLGEVINFLGGAYMAGYPQAPATYQKVVCEWLRSREDVWSQWLPSERDCLRGDVFNETLQDCVPCPAGTYAKTKGRTSTCLPCPGGTFSASDGSLECSLCTPGRFSAAGGASSSESCRRCLLGTFASLPGLTACEACNATFTIAFPGATDPADCTCPAGTYLRRDGTEGGGETFRCAACVTGLLCLGGKSAPLQAPGYAVDAFSTGGPTIIVACDGEAKCPGGTALGTCPEYRRGLACDLCTASTFERNGVCTPCEGWRSSSPLFIAAAVFAAVAAALVARGVRSRAHVSPASGVTVVLTVGIMLSTLQILNSFKKLTQNWPEPLASMDSVLRIFSFDFSTLRPSCVVRIIQPSSAYLCSLLVHPCFVVISSSAMMAVKPCGYTVVLDDVFNAQGIVVMAVYITLAVIALLPWQCTGNPDGTFSVTTNRSVLCWTTPEHRLMLLFSIIALAFYVVGAFTVAVWATWQYPSKIHSARGACFLRRFHFLFARFKAQRYQYAVAFMLRNFLVSVIPVIFVNEPVAAILLLVLVIGTACATQCHFYPWRETNVNHMDALTSLAVLLVLAGGAVLMVGDEVHMARTVQYFYLVLFSGVAVVLAAVSGHSFWRWRFPRRPFGCFLCHHKEAAAVLARWFKILLKDRTSEGVFLDSDELDNLDNLFEIVAYQTKYLIILLTAETMRRIWCAGEMATAVRYKTAMLPVACADFQHPSDEFIAGIDAHWTDAQKNQVFSQGVTVEDIKCGLQVVRNLPMLELDRSLPQAAQELVVDQIFTRCPGLRATGAGMLRRLGVNVPRLSGVVERTSSKSNVEQAQIVIAGNWPDPEATCICAVLQRLLQAALVVAVDVLGDGDTSLQRHVSARHLVAAMTRGVLEYTHFAVLLAEAHGSGAVHATPVIADASFRVPGEDFWGKLKSGHVDFDAKVLAQSLVTVQDVACAYRSLFRVLAVRFSAHGSSRIQAAEIQELAPRLLQRLTSPTVSGGLAPDKGPSSSQCEEQAATAPSDELASWFDAGDILDPVLSCRV